MPRKSKIRNTTLSPTARRKRMRLQLRRRHQRYERALNLLDNPTAVLMLFTGDLPDHLQQPTAMRGIRRQTNELNALHFSFTTDEDPTPEHPDNGVAPEPDVPRLLRPTSKPFEPDDGDRTGLLWLQSGHVISPADLVSWHSQGELRVPYYLETHSKSPPPGKGWALIYDSELQMILPGLNLKWNRRRATYWVRLVRDNHQRASELHIYSLTFKALFRLNIAISNCEALPSDIRSWWQPLQP